MKFEYPIRTRYSETAQDGIIHHSTYVIYLEVARIELFKSIGCDINALEKEKIFCPVVELSLKYLKPLYSLEDIIVAVTVEACSKVRFSLKYQILRDAACIAHATSSHCFVNELFKPIAIPHEILEHLKCE